MTPTLLQILGVLTLVLTATPLINGIPVNNQKTLSVEAKPGSAGHHGAVQSGQFLLTNNENYGLQISHAPYTAPSEEGESREQSPNAQPLVQPTQNINNGGETFCAGCTPLTKSQGQGNGYSGWNSNSQYQQQAQPVPVSQVPFSTGHNSGYSYSVNLQDQPGQRVGQQQGQQQPWGWNWQNQQAQNQMKQQWGGPQINTFSTEPASMQHIQISNDGGYSFSYNAPDSARQEQRNVDGTVSGQYSYQDPNGQQVQVDYRASPNEGFQAFGPSIPGQQTPSQVPVPQFQLPVPVQDTPEVQAARAQFFDAYNQQLQFIQQAHAEAKARAAEYQKSLNENQNQNGQYQGESTEGSKIVSVKSEAAEEQETNTNEPKKTPSDLKTEDSATHSEVEDDERDNDAVVISRDDEEPSSVPASVNVPSPPAKSPASQSQVNGNQGGPEASYKLSVFVGGDSTTTGGSGVESQNQGFWPQYQPFSIGYQGQQSVGQPLAMNNNYYYQGGQNFGAQPFAVGYRGQSPPSAVAVPVGSSFQYSHTIGQQQQSQAFPLGGYHQQQQQANQPQQQGYQNTGVTVPGMTLSPPTSVNGNNLDNTAQTSDSVSNFPGYFYYVSVGGVPQDGVPNQIFQSFPASLKAHLVSAVAVPFDGKHDAQVPHQNMGMVQNESGTKTTPYTSTSTAQNQNQGQGEPVTVVGFIPGALVSLKSGHSAFVSVNSASVARSGDGNANRDEASNKGHQIPLFIFRN